MRRSICRQLIHSILVLSLLSVCADHTPAFERFSDDAAGLKSSELPPIEDPNGAMQRFYQSLMRTEQSDSLRPTRIIHYGDSHVAADILTAALRRTFQLDFGNGGPGFVLAGRPWQWYSPPGATTSQSAGWITEGVRLAQKGDRRLGLAGLSVVTRRAGEWISLEAECRRFEIYFLGTPDGGAVDVLLDGRVVQREVSLASKTVEPVYVEVVAADEALHLVELRTVSAGLVKVFGIVAEHARAGVTYDALGINGARAGRLLLWDWPVLAGNLGRRAPDLIVVSYGSNEAGDEQLDPAEYSRALSELLDRFHDAVPQASLLVISPPDRAALVKGRWQAIKRMSALVAAQRRAALANGAAFWDLFSAMGGPGSIERWVTHRPPLAQSDRVHLTRTGYQMVARMLYEELMRGYLWGKVSGVGDATRGVER